MGKDVFRKGLVLGIIMLFFGAGVVPIISGTSESDIEITKYVKPDCYGAYQKDISFDIFDFSYVTYKIVVTNTGEYLIYNINILDILPTGLAYIMNSAIVDGVQYEPVISGNDLLWNTGSVLLPGHTLIITFRADVFDCGIHTNLVDVTGISCGGDYVYDQDSAIATVYGCYSSVYVDIKPGSCPNPINTKSGGVLPVAILGNEEFDVSTIDPYSIKITRDEYEGVAPKRWSLEDVATPFEGELCDCHDLNGDGYTDLALKFDKKKVVGDLNLGDVVGETLPLVITGNLLEEEGGTAIQGQDCVWIIK